MERSSTHGRELWLRAVTASIVGRPLSLPAVLSARYPELRDARWRVGGLPPRIGGWCLGARTVAGITFGRTVWLAPHVTLHPALLLHELCHVRQFGRTRAFALRYAWSSVRHGYAANRFEIEANAFADAVLRERPMVPLPVVPTMPVSAAR